ncbi:MAG: diguanylate cyclase [Oscillospiraceae bacterium]|nr:diguanylate cyclase [Oscillospiraceae bacterium]
MSDRNLNSVTPERMYQLAGKCFAGYLGYPSIEHMLRKSSCFAADLIRNSVSGLYLTEPLRHLYPQMKQADFETVLELLSEKCRAVEPDPPLSTMFSPDTLLSRFQAGEQYVQTEVNCSLMGIAYRLLIGCALYEDAAGICALFLICNVTQMQESDSRLMRMVEFDGLTGLYNRSAGDVHIMDYFRHYPQDSAAVLLIDLDYFKRFNDQYGHDIGDLVLRAAARQMEKCFGRDSVIVRNGGDEFLILLKNRTQKEAEEEIGRFFAEPHLVTKQEKTYRFSFSIGYAMYPEQGTEYHDLAMKADIAMYHVKMHHRSNFVQFRQDMRNQKRTQLSFHLGDLVSGIPGAILVYKADETEEILFANDQLYALFECDSMQELLQFSGDSFRNIVHPDDLDRVEREIFSQLKTNPHGLDYVSYRIITKTGKIKMIDDIGHLVHSPRYGNIFYVFLYDRLQKEQIVAEGKEIELAEAEAAEQEGTS